MKHVIRKPDTVIISRSYESRTKWALLKFWNNNSLYKIVAHSKLTRDWDNRSFVNVSNFCLIILTFTYLFIYCYSSIKKKTYDKNSKQNVTMHETHYELRRCRFSHWNAARSKYALLHFPSSRFPNSPFTRSNFKLHLLCAIETQV